jgi:MYXO-CTERM domain-containing protein
MRASTLLATFFLLTIAAQSRMARAQFVDPCEFQFRPVAGATIPANAPGIAFERGAMAKLEGLELRGPGGEIVPAQVLEQFGAPKWSVKPERSLAIGAHRIVADFSAPNNGVCPFDVNGLDGGGRHIEHAFSVGPEVPLPGSLGEIVVESGAQNGNVGDNTFEVTLAMADGAKPFLPLLSFSLRINGQISQSATPEKGPTQNGVIPRFTSFISCGVEAGAPSGFVNEGDNTLRIEGSLPGRDNPLNAEVIATVSCTGPTRLRPVGSAPAATPSNQATVSSCGCELPGTSSSSPLLALVPLVVLSIAWLARKRRST